MNSVINLKYNHQSNGTLLQTLAFFYLLIGSSYTKNLYSGELDTFINNSRGAQHVIAFTLLFTILLLTTDLNISYSLAYSSIIYLWFLLTTKMDLKWNIAIIVLIFGGFLYERMLLEKEKIILTDEVLEKEHIKKIKRDKKYTQKLIIGILFVLTCVGGYFYYNKQVGQMGGSMEEISMFRYLFG